MLKKLWQNEEGASMTEYVLLIALIGLAAFAFIQLFGEAIQALLAKATIRIGEAIKAF